MKRIFGFWWKRKGQPPSGGASVPCPAGACELRQNDLGKLHRAAAGGDLAQVRKGLKKYGIDGRDKAERTPLHLACANGHVDVVTYLVKNKCKLNLFDNYHRSPLMKAVQCQQEKCVAVLLKHGADPNLADADGNTALHLAVISPNTSVAGLLLEHNANIDAQNKEGHTPLILAVSKHHEEIVEFLLKNGADVNACDQCERTPLMTAASDGELNLIKVLLRYGADVSHRDTNGWSAEDLAVICGYSSVSKELAEYADCEDTGEASAGGAQGAMVLSTPHWARFMLAIPAVDRGDMQQSPNQTSRTGKSRKAIDDSSEGDSIRSSEKAGSDDSLPASEEELDFTPKKPQKPNLVLLMNASQQFRKNNGGGDSRMQSPKSPQDTQESWNRKSVIWEMFHRNADLCFADSEMTEWKKEIPQPLSDSCGLKEKKPSFDDSFESSNKSWSAAKNPRLESRRPNSVILEHVDEDPEEERYEAVDSKVGKVLKQGSGNSYLNRPKGNLRAAFHLSAEEESLEREEEEKQEKKDAGEELQTAGVEGVKKSVCNGSRQVHNASKDDAGALPEAGPEEEEDAGSPWDSEIIEMDAESLRKTSYVVVLPPADRYGACSQIASGKGDSGFLEKPSSSQLKTPESVLEMGETSPKKRRQESDEYSGSTFPTSSSAEKDDIKDAIENCGVQVEKEKSEQRCFKTQVVAKQEDLDKLNIPSGNVTNQQVKQKPTGREDDCLKMETENSLAEKDKKSFSSEERSKLIQLPMKGFTVKREEEKRLRVEMLYEKAREKLRRKEDVYCKEIEEKQQLELPSRDSEMELLTLRKLQKQESNTEREKDLLHKTQLLQDEIAMLRLELDQVRLRHQEEEGEYLEENEALKEKIEDLKKELKLKEEALTQTVFQYNGQLNLLKTETAVLASKLEETKESKDRLETEMESFRSRLNIAVQELERHQSSKTGVERTFQRERDEWLRLQDKLHHDLSDVQETNKSLSQQLSKAESKANSLENELLQLKQTLREKTLLLEMTQKELSQAQAQAKECDHARQLEKDQVGKFIIKQEYMQERLAQLWSENLLLRQQLEDVQNQRIIKEKVVSDVQDWFNDMFNKLRADTEKQVCLVEERNKELNAECTALREQAFNYEMDKIEREGMVRQLQQELANALKKQSVSEASLEVTTCYRSDLEEEKLHLQKELEKVKTKLQELEEQRLQSEHCVCDLKTALANKKREERAPSQKLQDLLLASSGTNATIKQLEEHMQCVEIENARLEATVEQQSSRIEALEGDLQASASVHNCLEDLITGLGTRQAAAEDHHQQQCESEREKVKKLVELKCPVELRLDQETKRNIEPQKDCKRMKRLLNRAMKKLRVYEERERESQLNLQGEMKNRYSEMVSEVDRLRTKVGELSQQLETESKNCKQVEAQNQDLREELSTMHVKQEKLEKRKCQLKEEVANLKHHLETNMVDRSQIEQYKREMEERAGQEIRQKLQEVNLFLQVQAASQDRLEQIRASHHASLRKQLKERIRDLECELDRIKNTQQDGIFQRESTQAEVEKYKELYLEEVKMRSCLANKLERANERLAEAHPLLQEHHRSKSFIASSVVSGGLAASPVLYSAELGHLGNNLTLNRSLSLGSFLSSAGNAPSSGNRVEAYVAKVRGVDITERTREAISTVPSAGAVLQGSSRKEAKFRDPQQKWNKEKAGTRAQKGQGAGNNITHNKCSGSDKARPQHKAVTVASALARMVGIQLGCRLSPCVSRCAPACL
ncbi:LOW QUALITY PROTEIN: uncharacterized protein RG961_004576 [Leptosomus discolor]